jgi:hypothetical protein
MMLAKLCFAVSARGCRLAWSRLVDLGSIDPGSNPGSPITFSVDSKWFIELHVENSVIRCFKWFSKVLLGLKPNSLDFSTNSLSKYKTKLCLFGIAYAPEGKRGDVQCYISGDFLISNLKKK